jgi:ABC-type branched-subunit amino acid transport system permease subunit
LAIELVWFAVLVLYPLLFDSFGPSFGQRMVIFTLLVLSLDLVWGVSGIFNLGQAAFFAAGAYTVALLNTEEGVTSGAVLVVAAMGLPALLALIVGLFLFGSRDEAGIWYVGLATLALSYAMERFIQATHWLGSDSGVFGVADISLPPVTGDSAYQSYYALLAVLGGVYVGAALLLRSRWGVRLTAIRDDAERMRYLGYRVNSYRIFVFVLGGAIAGLAGGLLAITQSFVTPSLAGVGQSTTVLLAMILGGPGYLIGAVFGAGLYSIAEFKLSEAYPTAWQIGLGLGLVGLIVLLPKGLVGALVEDLLPRLRGRLRRPLTSKPKGDLGELT